LDAPPLPHVLTNVVEKEAEEIADCFCLADSVNKVPSLLSPSHTKHTSQGHHGQSSRDHPQGGNRSRDNGHSKEHGKSKGKTHSKHGGRGSSGGDGDSGGGGGQGEPTPR